jgi:predicted enzyme related to lactoylglutathione lyase
MSSEVKSEVGQVVWHTLNTSDVERAKAFYGELLGWDVETTSMGGQEVDIVNVNGAGHADFQQASGGAPSSWLSHVRVESVDESLRRAEARGAKALVGPTDLPEIGRLCVIQDPQGAVLSVYTPAAEFPVTHDAFAWDELMSDDVDASTAFYTDVVGWSTGAMDMGQFVYTLFKRRDDDQGSAGLLPKPDAAAGMPNAWVTYLTTDDVDAATAKARELGATVYMEGTDIANVGRIGMIADPTGAMVGLFKPNM